MYINLTDFNKEFDCFNTESTRSENFIYCIDCKDCSIGKTAKEINLKYGDKDNVNVEQALKFLKIQFNLKLNDNAKCFTLAKYINKQVNLEAWSKLCN